MSLQFLNLLLIILNLQKTYKIILYHFFNFDSLKLLVHFLDLKKLSILKSFEK